MSNQTGLFIKNLIQDIIYDTIKYFTQIIHFHGHNLGAKYHLISEKSLREMKEITMT
jgi:hypothetical protein